MCCDRIAAMVDRKQTVRYRADPPAQALRAKMEPEPPSKFVCPRDQPHSKKSGSRISAVARGETKESKQAFHVPENGELTWQACEVPNVQTRSDLPSRENRCAIYMAYTTAASDMRGVCMGATGSHTSKAGLYRSTVCVV